MKPEDVPDDFTIQLIRSGLGSQHRCEKQAAASDPPGQLRMCACWRLLELRRFYGGRRWERVPAWKLKRKLRAYFAQDTGGIVDR